GTFLLMPGNALRHVLIPRLCSSHKEYVIPAQLLGEPLCVSTLPTTSSSQDQEQTSHPHVSSARLLTSAITIAYSVLLPTQLAFLFGPNRFGASLGTFSLSLALHLAQQISVIVECSGQIGMFRSKRALHQRHSALIEQCSCSVFVLSFRHHRQVVQRCG